MGNPKIKFDNTGYPVDVGDYNWGFMRLFKAFVLHASPEIREEMRREIEREMKWTESAHRISGHVDWRHFVDLGDKYQGWGKNHLYIWLNGDNLPFYVGQAQNKDRPGQFKYKTRSPEFKEIIRQGGCHAVVVANHIPDSKINDLEMELLAYLCWKEYPIVNNVGIPRVAECRLAKRFLEDSKTSMEALFLMQTEYREEMTAIFSVLEKVIGVPWEGECADMTPPDLKKMYAERVIYWDVNGERRPAVEYCEERGVNYGRTVKLMDRYGLSPEEATSLPPVPSNMSRKSVQYWESLGFDFFRKNDTIA